MDDLTTLAGFFAILVAALTAMQLVTENFERILNSFKRWKDIRNKPKYILIPTPEELARYSAQEPQWELLTKIDIENMHKERRGNALFRQTRMRIVMVMVTFTLLYFALGLRLLYIGILSESR